MHLPPITREILERFREELIIDESSGTPEWTTAARELLQIATLSPNMRRELQQCIRLALYRAEQDEKQQTARDVKAGLQEQVERRKELLKLFGG